MGVGPNHLHAAGMILQVPPSPRSPSSSVHCSQPCTDHRNSLSPMASWALLAASSYGRWAGSKSGEKTCAPFWWSHVHTEHVMIFGAFWCITTQGVLFRDTCFWHLVGCHHVLLPTNMEMHMIHIFPRIDDFMCSESASRFDLRFMPFPYSAISDHWINMKTKYVTPKSLKLSHWLSQFHAYSAYSLSIDESASKTAFHVYIGRGLGAPLHKGHFISMQYHPIFGRIREKGAEGERHHSRKFQHTSAQKNGVCG